MTVLFINLMAAIAFFISLYYSRRKTKKAVLKAIKKGVKLAPQLLFIIAAIGFVFAFLPPELIKEYLGGQFSFLQVILSAGFGAIMMIPSLIALPLAGSLIEAGASYTPIAAFITTLTMVGFVTIPVELEELGKKFTIYRNLMALLFAVLIALLMGVIL